MSTSNPQAAKRRRQRLPRWLRTLLAPLILAGTLGISFGLGVWGTLRVMVRVPEITMPDLSGIDLPEAEKRLAGLGLLAEVSARRHDQDRPAGRVLEQFPRAGARTKAGRPVRLSVSLGPAQSIVPDLLGGTLGRAQLALRAAGLKVERQAAVYHAHLSVGRVVAQHPSPSYAGFPGEGVTLLLSQGPPPRAFVMPDLSGRAAAAALADFRDCGFRELTTEGEGDAAGAVVVGQSPQPGSPVTTQDRVVLRLRGRGGR